MYTIYIYVCVCVGIWFAEKRWYPEKGLIVTGMEGFSGPRVVYGNEIEMEKITSPLPLHHSRLLFRIHSKTVFYFVFTTCTIYVCNIYFIFRREKNILLFRPPPRGSNPERYICIQTEKYKIKIKKIRP